MSKIKVLSVIVVFILCVLLDGIKKQTATAYTQPQIAEPQPAIVQESYACAPCASYV